MLGLLGQEKSSLLYGLAEAVSNGSDFMGQLTTKRGKVCFIQSDESPENAADTLKVMGVNAEFHLLTDWKFLDVSKLRALQEQEHYDLIVLDSITTLLSRVWSSAGAQGLIAAQRSRQCLTGRFS